MTRMLTIAQTTWRSILRRKDLYVLLILMAAMLVSLTSLDVFGLGGASIYVIDIGLLMAWVFSWILSVHASARELPEEETRGTIFPLLARPVTRLDLVLGKWLGSWSAVCIATLAFYGLIAVFVRAKGHSLDPITLTQGFILHSAALAVISAIAVAFSTRMNHDAAATLTFVLTGASFLVVPRVPEFISRESGLAAGFLMFLYNALPHFEVFDLRKRISFDYGPCSTTTFVLVLAYGAAWSAAVLAIAWMAYRHKRFSRDSLAG